MKHSSHDSGDRLVSKLTELLWYPRFVVQVLATTLIFLAGVSYFVYQAFAQQYQNVAEIFQVVSPELQHQLVFNNIVRRNVTFVVLCTLAYISTLVFLSLRSRQRYARPLAAAHELIEAVARGEYAHRAALRRGDEMPALVSALNNMAEQMERRHGPRARQGSGDKASVS